MRVLITGSQGYVGTRLTQLLASREVECHGCDPQYFDDCRLLPGSDPPIPYADVRELTHDDIESYDAVVHLAGISNDPFGSFTAAQVYDPTRAYSLHLAKLCAAVGTRLIFASSCSVYGRQESVLCDETTMARPQTAYSQNKLDIETDLLDLSQESQGAFQPIILRFATAFGLSPRMRFDIVINMLAGLAVTKRRIVLNSDGQAWRPHVHLDDMCRAVEWALQADLEMQGPAILNVGGPDCNRRIIDIAELIQQNVPGCELAFLDPVDSESYELIRDRKIQDGADQRTYRVSFELIRQAFPAFACRSLDEQVVQFVDQLRALPLDAEDFSDNRFYRLQRYEWLVAQGRLDWNVTPSNLT